MLSGSLLTSVLLGKHTHTHKFEEHNEKSFCNAVMQCCTVCQMYDARIYLVVVKQRPPTFSVSQSVCV